MPRRGSPDRHLSEEFEDGGNPRESRPGRWFPMSSSRVTEARYDSGLQQVQVVFRDGTPWVYDGVPVNEWRNFRRSASPGKYINRVLNNHPYWRGSFNYASYEETHQQ